jgi:hypothetical protein
LEEARKIRAQYLNSSQANSPSVTLEPIREEAGMGDMEPGFDELGFSGESAKNGGNNGSEKRDSGALPINQGSIEAGMMGGSKDLLSIGKVGNASQSLQSSESTAATLIQGHMAQLAQESIIQALTRAHASIHAAPASLPIATITDLRNAMKLAQEATGLDSKQNNTQLNILVSPTPKQGTWNFHDSPESPVIDT